MQKYIEENFFTSNTDKLCGSLSNNITKIDNSNFSNGIEKTFKKIEFSEFPFFSNLVTLDLSNCENLKKIKEFAFKDAYSLQDIKFPTSLKKIKSGSFENCTSLMKLDLSYLLKISEIPCDFLKKSWALKEIIFPPNIRKIGTRSFTD